MERQRELFHPLAQIRKKTPCLVFVLHIPAHRGHGFQRIVNANSRGT
jgi:hypothetical protein